MSTYTIKPLKWKRGKNYNNLPRAETSTIFGSMEVQKLEDGDYGWSYCFDEYYDEGYGNCESIKAGIEYLNQFYLERLLPALKVQP